MTPAALPPPMTWIDLAWPMLGGACMTLALVHLLAWVQDRTRPAQLMLGLAAASVAVLAVVELLLMRAPTPPAYAALLRWAHVPVTLLVVSLVLFVLLYFRAGRPWLALAACALRVGALLPNVLSGANLNFRSITALDRVTAWGGGAVAVPVGEPNPWMLLGVLSNLLVLAFLVDAIATTRRRDDPGQGRRALLMCGGIAVFVLLANAWTVAVVMAWIRGPLTVNVAFIAVIAAMSHALGGDVLRSAQLARRLADSEARLRASLQRVQLAARAAGLRLWTWDVDGDLLWFTGTGRAAPRATPRRRLRLGTWLARVHPQDRGGILRAREESLRGSGAFTCEFRLPRDGGHPRWIAAKGRPEPGPPGTPRVIHGVLMDVTEWRHAEERFRRVIDGASTAMLVVDGAGRVTLANPQAERVFGYGHAGLLGVEIDTLVPDAARLAHDGPQGTTTEPPARAPGAGRELHARRSDGSRLRVEVGLTPITIADARCVLMSVTDISERLRLQEEAALQRDELAHLSRVTLLGEMSGALAHELNQPMTAILSNAQAALRFLQRDPPDLGEVHDSLVHIVESDKRASEVIRRLRAMLRKEPASFQPLSINEVVRDVLRLIHGDLLARRVGVALQLAPGLPSIGGDRVQLQQVLLNLVFNACDAMDDVATGRILTVRTHRVPGPAVGLAISDVGRGLPAGDPDRIFTPFVTSKRDGIGLGLPICRTIIQAHRGTLWATGNPAGGATLHVVLPASAPAPRPCVGATATEAARRARG